LLFGDERSRFAKELSTKINRLRVHPSNIERFGSLRIVNNKSASIIGAVIPVGYLVLNQLKLIIPNMRHQIAV
jgi:hypothetical protein